MKGIKRKINKLKGIPNFNWNNYILTKQKPIATK